MIILRHDVDDAFSVGSYFSKGLNYLSIKLGKIFPRSRSFGFLRDALNLFEREREIGIRATWFFRTLTRPFPEFKRELLSEGHEIAFHADRIENKEFFKKDLEYVAQGIKILGFSKHGNRGLPTPAGLGLGEVYNLSLYIRRAKEFGFLYFAGNDVNPTDEFKVLDGIVVFPSAFWIAPGYMDDRKFTIDWQLQSTKIAKTRHKNVEVGRSP
ncbi:MAG: hypothetical protein QW595_03360 [Candidatus Bathyarchaeia archaeon]